MKKVVVIGTGAREHALVRALLRGAAAGGPREVIAIPGNPGIARECRCVPCSMDAEMLAKATILEAPDLAVVGPEAPLAAGLADLLAQAKIPCFGPSAAAAQIEASKTFAKDVMRAAGVPMARGESFVDPALALEHARRAGACVVKLDGLAAGKGVIVCDGPAQAVAAVEELWALAIAQARAQRGSAAQAGAGEPAARTDPPARILIEERLSGPEISVIALVDGEQILVLPPARDHKRLLEGDQGPNTGGMGAVSPPRQGTQALLDEVLETVLRPTVLELKRRGAPFRGALFAGLMLTPDGLRVLEFNCRFGDPEAQAILMRLRGDVLPLLEACANGTLAGHSLEVDPRASVAIVLAAHGYPAAPRAGDVIAGLDALDAAQPRAEIAGAGPLSAAAQNAADSAGARDGLHANDLAIFHAGTKQRGEEIVTAGGRVLSLCALGDSVREARARAYALAERVTFPGRQLRRDIAAAEE